MQNTDKNYNTDVNSTVEEEKQENDISQTDEDIPLPPDSRPNSPIEEPADTEKPAIDEDSEDNVKRIM